MKLKINEINFFISIDRIIINTSITKNYMTNNNNNNNKNLATPTCLEMWLHWT